MIGAYAKNLLLATSRFLSALLGGHADDSISKRTAVAYLLSPPHSLRARVIEFQMRAIDRLFQVLTGEVRHCENSLSGESVAVESWSWSGQPRPKTADEVIRLMTP